MPTTSTKGIPYPLAADNNDAAGDMGVIANYLDTMIGNVYTAAAAAALAAGQKWTGRRIYVSDLNRFQWWNGTAWVDESVLTVNAQVGITYTLVLADASTKGITLSNAAAISLIIPTNATVALPVGIIIPCWQLGAGQVTVSHASGGAALLGTPGLKARTQYSAFSLFQYAANQWIIQGDLVA